MKLKVLSLFCLISIISVAQASIVPKKVVCYYGTWATWRTGVAQFNVNNINANLCTHVVYSFFGVTVDGQITYLDEWLDINMGNIREFMTLRQQNPNIVLMASVGGYNFGSEIFSMLARNPTARTNFARNTVTFMRLHGFNGFDVDWEYPVSDGIPEDRENFILLLQELRAHLQPNGFVLSVAVAAGQYAAARSYDIPRLSNAVDFINLMTYDFHGPWSGVTGIHGAFSYRQIENFWQRQVNVRMSVHFWLKQGAAANKLIVGIPFYGNSFTLTSAANHGLDAPISGPGTSGRFVQPNMLGFDEICMNRWTRVWEAEQQVPYAFNGDQWVGYDDVQSVQIKSNFIMNNNLGGAMIWSIETDDFRGNCGLGRFPLLTAIHNILRQ
ncbi:unnamed protein product [Diamesa tonsa]